MAWLRDFGHDLHQGARSLRRQPGFTALAVTILALGVGGATAMFSILDAVLLRPLPVPDADRLVRIHRTMPGDSADSPDRMHAPGDFLAYHARRDVFEGVAAVDPAAGRFQIDPEAPAERILGARVSADFFPVFRVKPRLGRVFSPDEYQPGRDRVVLLSTQLWQTRFDGDPGVVGRRVRIGGEPFTVVGVMPAELHDPVRYWSRGLFWRPLALPPGAATNDRDPWLRLFARLSSGTSREMAQAVAGAAAAGLDADHRTGSGARLVTPQETGAFDVGGTRVVWLSAGLGVLLLLIACLDLAGLQLARLAARGHDLAIRAALGAGRGRLVRALVTESVLLSVIGGAVGVLVAHACVGVLASRITIGWSWVSVGIPAHLDRRVLTFALALVLLTAVVVGAVPAWLSARDAVAVGLRTGGRGSGGESRWPRLREAVVVLEMALALVLLAAGGLFLRGLDKFVERDLGWRLDGLLTARLDLPGPNHQGERGELFLAELERRLVALPGVERAALAHNLPFWDNGLRARGVWLQGAPRPRPGEGPSAFPAAVSAGYFQTIGLPLREGRLFRAGDPANREVIVNETMARELWPGKSALGKHLGDFEGDPARPGHWWTVVGVVPDVRFAATLTAPVTRYHVYRPLRAPDGATIAIRTKGSPEALAPALRRLIVQLDPNASLSQVSSARALVDRNLRNTSLLAWTLFAFALLGVALAALGVYGLFSGLVVQRTREIGVRMALGAETRQVFRMVLGKGLRIALVGGVFGVAGAHAIVSVLKTATSELADHGPFAVLVLAATLIAVALFACWWPARRAAALDPMVALRQD